MSATWPLTGVMYKVETVYGNKTVEGPFLTREAADSWWERNPGAQFCDSWEAPTSEP